MVLQKRGPGFTLRDADSRRKRVTEHDGIERVTQGVVAKPLCVGPEFHVLALLSAAGGVVMASSYDLIVMFLGLEILSIPLYVKRKAAPGPADGPQTLRQSWDAWEASGRPFWEQMDAVVDMLDGLVGDESEVTNG